MATNPLRAESVPTNPLNIFSTFDRGTIASAVEVLVALLDTMDGDPDVEDDDPSGQCDEDDLNTNLHVRWATGPGCAISDQGIADTGGFHC